MSEFLKKYLSSGTGLLLLLVAFIAIVVINQNVLRGARVDLTENNLYTVTDGTKNILRDIEEPINVYFFFSDKATEGLPGLRAYATRVREMLEEFRAIAKGNIKLQVIDPIAFSEEEDQAAEFGLQGRQTTSGDMVFFGLAATNTVDDQELIPYFDPANEASLEYDLAKTIYALSQGSKPSIGLISKLPIAGVSDPQSGQPGQPWLIKSELDQLFRISELSPELTEVDVNLDFLIVVHPKELSEPAQYAIDQFVLRGGRALFFVDPYAETDVTAADPNNFAAQYLATRSSDLNKLFETWGFSIDPSKFVGDNRYALQVSAGAGAPVRHLGLLGLGVDAMSQDDITTAQLSTINMGSSGFIVPTEDSSVIIEPLLSSSDQAMPLDIEQLKFLRDPSVLLDGFKATGERYTLAARISGELTTAFPERPADVVATLPHKDSSDGVVNMVVVADTDLLTDRLWAQVMAFFGQRVANPFANNSDFINNVVENLAGSSDLIGVRRRGSFQRPFDRVIELQAIADKAFRDREETLQQELEDTETKLNQLQSARNDNQQMIVTDEQREEINNFIKRRSEVRKELRKVRRDLDRDIEALHRNLKIINIVFVPFLIVLFAVGAYLFRQRGREAKR